MRQAGRVKTVASSQRGSGSPDRGRSGSVGVDRPVVQPFELDTEQLFDGCDLVEVRGELDLGTADGLRAALDSAVERRRNVVLDLAGCEFIDSTCIAVVIRGSLALARWGRLLRVARPGQTVRRQLAVAGLGESPLLGGSLDAAAEEIRAASAAAA
jgi:anti-anti-sigma factor